MQPVVQGEAEESQAGYSYATSDTGERPRGRGKSLAEDKRTYGLQESFGIYTVWFSNWEERYSQGRSLASLCFR